MIPVLGSMALAIGYTVVVGWIFKYAFLALSGNLYTLGQDMEAIGALFDGTASSFGNNGWLMVTVLVTAVIMAFGIAGGIEKANQGDDAAFVCFVSGTGGIHFCTAWLGKRISLHFYHQSGGTERCPPVDLCLWPGIFLAVHCGKWNGDLWILSE